MIMIIYIEGNIGSGKTTLCELIKNHYKDDDSIQVVFEPVDEWINTKDSKGENILDKFYKDQQKWSFAFQMNSFVSRVNKINKFINDKNNTLIFVERSVFTDKHCFAKNCFESGDMDEMEYNIYNKWHQWLVDSFQLKPDGYVYLKCSPNIAQERIKKRSRTEEDTIPLEYLTKLHNAHNSWLEQEEKNNVPVLTLDVSDNYIENKEKIEKVISSIKEKFLV